MPSGLETHVLAGTGWGSRVSARLGGHRRRTQYLASGRRSHGYRGTSDAVQVTWWRGEGRGGGEDR